MLHGGYTTYIRKSFIGQVEIELNRQRENISLQEYWDLRTTVVGFYQAPAGFQTMGFEGSTKYFNEDDINFIHKHYITGKVRPNPIIAQYGGGLAIRQDFSLFAWSPLKTVITSGILGGGSVEAAGIGEYIGVFDYYRHLKAEGKSISKNHAELIFAMYIDIKEEIERPNPRFVPIAGPRS